MPSSESSRFIEITFQTTSSPRILAVCRELSTLLSSEHIQIQPPPGVDTSGVTLRAHLPADTADDHWPAIQSLLDEHGLLDESKVNRHEPAAGETTRLWPFPEE